MELNRHDLDRSASQRLGGISIEVTRNNNNKTMTTDSGAVRGSDTHCVLRRFARAKLQHCTTRTHSHTPITYGAHASSELRTHEQYEA